MKPSQSKRVDTMARFATWLIAASPLSAMRFGAVFAAIIFVFLAPVSAQAEPVIITTGDNQEIAEAIANLEVGGKTYLVEFTEGTAKDIYGDPEGQPDFDFSNEQDAWAANEAILAALSGYPSGELLRVGSATNNANTFFIAYETVFIDLSSRNGFNQTTGAYDDLIQDWNTKGIPVTTLGDSLLMYAVFTEDDTPTIPEPPIDVDGEPEFGNVQIGTEEVETFNIASLAMVPITIEGIDIEDNTGGAFTIDPIALPTSIDEDDGLPLIVRFQPDAPGPYNARLNLSYIVETEPETAGQVIVRLTGIGLDFPEIEITEHTVHEITDAKLKATFVDDDGKTKTENLNKKDLGSLLCGGRDLEKKEKLALYAPCPAVAILDTQSVFLGVYNRDTGDNVCNIESIGLEEPQVEFKENAIQRITALFFGDFAAEIGEDEVELGIFGSLDATTKFVKRDKFPDLPLAETNCFHKVKTKSVVGAIEENGDDDAVIESGKLKAGKVKDVISGSDIVDEICGIDCVF